MSADRDPVRTGEPDAEAVRTAHPGAGRVASIYAPLPPRRHFPRLWQGARPRWVPLRWWEQAFAVGYDLARQDIARGYVESPTARTATAAAGRGCYAPMTEEKS